MLVPHWMTTPASSRPGTVADLPLRSPLMLVMAHKIGQCKRHGSLMTAIALPSGQGRSARKGLATIKTACQSSCKPRNPTLCLCEHPCDCHLCRFIPEGTWARHPAPTQRCNQPWPCFTVPPGYNRNDDLPALYKQVATLLKLRADSVPESTKGSQSVAMILRTLTTTVQGLAELRNELGLGHGRSAASPALARHARLALNSAVTVRAIRRCQIYANF